jgi:predicted transcriptional regulator
VANKHNRHIRNSGIAKKRRMVGLTQHQLADETGIPVSRVVFAETGRIELEPEELDRVRDVFRQRAKKAMAAVA